MLDKALVKRITKNNIIVFAVIAVSNIAVIWLFLPIALGIGVFTASVLKIAAITIAIDLAVAALCIYIYSKMNKNAYDVLEKAGTETDSEGETLTRFSDRFVLKSCALIAGADIIFGVLMIASLAYIERLVGLEIGAYSITVAGLTVIDVGLLFFWLKISFFKLSQTFPEIHPLPFPTKIILPVLNVILFIFLIAAAASYHQIDVSSINTFYDDMQRTVRLKNEQLNNFRNGYASELMAYTVCDEIQSMDMATIQRFLIQIRNKKSIYFDTLWVADPQGLARDDLQRGQYVGNQDYFTSVMSTGQPFFTDKHYSDVSNKNVYTISFPIKNANGATVGVMGGNITETMLDEVFISDDTAIKNGNINLISSSGRFWYSTNKNLIDLTIGKSEALTDNGETVKNVENVIDAPEKEIFEFTFAGTDFLACKVKNTDMNLSVLLTIEKTAAREAAEKSLPLLMLILIGGISIIGLPILRLQIKTIRDVSVPLRGIIKRLDNAELSMGNPNYTDDEFGFFLKNFIDYTNKMHSIVLQVVDTTQSIKAVSQEFEAASRSLSEGTQSRAASVEEATAAIEEVAASVERINETATTQKETAAVNFSTVEGLKNGVGDVLNSTIETLSIAKRTSEEAKTGNKLMHNTITGMNNIDTSTKKIAEMIRLISDISDQVSLLAINASIESARAGEQGKGFAVVAEEISKLADETATTAKNINDLVKAGLKEVAAGLKYADDTNAAFDTIMADIERTEKLINQITEASKVQFAASERVLGNVKRMMEMAETISVASNEQMITNQEMTKTIEQINQGTLSEAARAEEIASSAAEIDTQAAVLEEEIKAFRI